MDQYIEFVSNHLMLSAALLVITIMLVYTFVAPYLRAWKSVTPQEATRLINHDQAVILDIREDREFQGGHIVNSIHIPMGMVNKRLADLEKHKDKPIIVGCRSGSRSASTCNVLSKNGFEKVYNLGGGIMAWEGASLPLSKK